jgi:hypothetical protein
MRYPVILEGFEGQKIEVEYPFFKSPRLLVDKEPAPKGRVWGTLVISRNDGREQLVAWRPRFPDVPQLVVAGKFINVVAPLKVYEWVWCALPILLIFLPNFISGTLVGLLGIWVNVQLFRTGLKPWQKYAAAAGGSMLSAGIYYLLAQFMSTAG